jgi:hypothetical protein
VSLSRQEQREIVQADRDRRIMRDVEAWLLLESEASHGSLTRADGMALDYTPNRHRTTRASRSTWDRPMYVRGIAPGTEATSDGTPTVLCTYADGTSEVRTVASFRKRQPRAQRVPARQASHTRARPIMTDDPRFEPHTELAAE